jgi:hypothetical protein
MTKYIFIAAMLGVALLSSCGQQMKMVKTSKSDSLAVEAVWKQYVKAIATKNVRTLKKLSVTADVYIKSTLRMLPRTKLWQAVQTTKHFILTEKIKNYKPQNINTSDDVLNVYDIWYATRQPDKIKGYEGVRYAFQFVKEQGQFKFFGLTSLK